MARPVAVIDIGSNSIKVLVAQRVADGTVSSLLMKTVDARISAGISESEPRLSEEGMNCGIAAVQNLLADAAPFQPGQIQIVATSAVRDAANGTDFTQRVRSATGHPVRVLTGDDEANSIGRGLTCDPALAGLRDFYVFDLGGGSLECLAFLDRKIVRAESLRLGCVRLMERCVADPTREFSEGDQRNVASVTLEVLAKSGFSFSLPPHAVAVGSGGTLTTARIILAARRGKAFEQSSSLLTLAELRELLAYVARCNLEDRRRIPGMPPARADVFPTALATVIAIAEFGGLDAYRNSTYNLRWGIADELLA